MERGCVWNHVENVPDGAILVLPNSRLLFSYVSCKLVNSCCSNVVAIEREVGVALAMFSCQSRLFRQMPMCVGCSPSPKSNGPFDGGSSGTVLHVIIKSVFSQVNLIVHRRTPQKGKKQRLADRLPSEKENR